MDSPLLPSEPPDFHRALFLGMAHACTWARMLFEGDEPVDWLYLEVNPAFGRQSGLGDCAGKRISELVPGARAALPELFAAYGRVARGGAPEHLETYAPWHEDWYAVDILPGGAGTFIAVFTLITAAKAEQAQAQACRARMAGFLELSPDPISISRASDGVRLMVNRAWCESTGIPMEAATGAAEEGLGTWMRAEDRAELFAELRLAGAIPPREIQARRADGSPFPALISARRVNIGGSDEVVIMGKDITAQKALQEAELSHRKADSLVLMAGSIAHDFNNLFGALSASLEILGLQGKDRPELLATVATATEVLQRAVALSWKMNDFAGRALPALTWTSLPDLIAGWAPAWGDRNRGRRPLLDLGTVPRIKADAAMLRKVLAAVVENAWEAMDEARVAGSVRISLGEAEPGEREDEGVWAAPRPQGRATVCLEIANDGPCPAPDILARMFDPFFTTRFLGRGLGLASVLGLLQNHGAGIHVRAGKAGGMAFRIHFPIAAA